MWATIWETEGNVKAHKEQTFLFMTKLTEHIKNNHTFAYQVCTCERSTHERSHPWETFQTMGTTSSLVMNVTISATRGNRKGKHYKEQHRKISIVDDLRTLFVWGLIISFLVKDLSQSGHAKLSYTDFCQLSPCLLRSDICLNFFITFRSPYKISEP